ncbi:hypothetical protein BJY24_006089 [Nocardia transvalensis]|uniref:DnaJ homologue subfamily C member 28 conserved domain-containing protein n=1 Tax=Nocardia transvalensis TaxID=37333 RepID=A0A7W9ULA8_9NOCA|nr:DUF1992 domain-containing protein [Nocardia transvalensis]MBB5917177.1 hypothetical protein [Nocardia transvalensis]
MTERKPAGMTYESWLDKQIREATERGDFTDLPGAGKPIPGAGQPLDEDWWLNDYLRREGVTGDGVLPPSLLLRRDLEQLPERVQRLRFERDVRELAADLNARIVDWQRMPTGPHVRVAPVDVDEVVEEWRTARTPAPEAPSPSDTAPEPPKPSRWRRLFGAR